MAPIQKEKRGGVSNKKRFCYSPSKVQSAVKAVQNGMPASKASKVFGVPRSTLRHKVAGRAPLSSGHVGPQAILGTDIEKHLEEWILEIARMGFPITKEQLFDSVQKVVETSNMETPFHNGRPGRKWYDSFLKRHPKISCKKAEYLNKARANVTEGQIRNWFEEVKSLLGEDENVLARPHSVYNTDETSFFLCPKGTLVLAPKGENTYDVACSDKENITTLITVNAAGEIAPPLTVFKYLRLPQHIIKSAPDNWGIGISDSGWMTGKTFYEYIVNIFYPYLVEKKALFPVIIFLDGHKSHITLHLSNFCRDKKIIIVALYPNTTHMLQPLDVSVFGPLKQRWKSFCRKWRYEHNFEDITKYNICQALNELIFHPSVTSAIKSGFESCGIYPFNPDNVNYSKCIPKVKSSAVISSSMDSNQLSYLEHLESYIEPDLMKQFRDTRSKEMDWQGDLSASMLYDIWLKFQETETKEDSLIDFVTSTTLNRNGKDVEECPTVVASTSNTDIISISPGRKSAIPALQNALLWPGEESTPTNKKRRNYQRVPSVITSDQGKIFLEEKEKKKKITPRKKISKKSNYSNKEEDWNCHICKNSWFVEDKNGISSKWIECDQCKKQFHFECLPGTFVKTFQLDEPESSDEEYSFMCMDCTKFNNSDEFSDEFD